MTKQDEKSQKLTPHNCRVDKLAAVWEINNFTKTSVSRGNWHVKWQCVCGKLFTWEELVDVIPFKELSK